MAFCPGCSFAPDRQESSPGILNMTLPKLEFIGQTDVGTRRRVNQDTYATDAESGLFLICDGMGGHAGGEIASRMAVDLVMSEMRSGAHPQANGHDGSSSPISARGQLLRSALIKANTAIYQAALGSENAGMGSTIVALMLTGKTATIAHIGDSRAYLFRRGKLRQLTEDHSLVLEEVKMGVITAEMARTSPHRNVITRALGPSEKVEPDLSEFKIKPGDLVMMATDGITKPVPEPEILAILSSDKDLKTKCNDLIESAKKNGGEDNLTCVLLQVQSIPWHKRLFGGANVPTAQTTPQ